MDIPIVVFLLAVGVYYWAMVHKEEGDYCHIFLDNKKYASYAFSGETKKIVLDGKLGPIEIEIGPEGARVLRAPCPQKICVKMGRAHYGGHKLICLPSKMLLRVSSSTEKKSPHSVDGVTF